MEALLKALVEKPCSLEKASHCYLKAAEVEVPSEKPLWVEEPRLPDHSRLKEISTWHTVRYQHGEVSILQHYA